MSYLNLAIDLFHRAHPDWEKNEPMCENDEYPFCVDRPVCPNCPKLAYSDKASEIVQEYEDRIEKAYKLSGWSGIMMVEAAVMKEVMEQEFTKVCAWCDRVKRDGKWTHDVVEDDEKVTHVMCEECFEKITGEKA